MSSRQQLQRGLSRIAVLTALLVFGSQAMAADPLTQRGIDPTILDVMVSSLSQDLAYKQQADIQIVTRNQAFEDRALIFYEPTTEYGIDFYMKFDETKIDTMAPARFRSMLENRMRLQHRLKVMEFQYDPRTIEVESQHGDEAVILFRYQKYALPQAVAWMRFLQGRVWVKGDRVLRMRLEADEGISFLSDGMQVSGMVMDAEFVRAPNGRDLLNVVNSTIEGKYYGWKLFKWGEPFTIHFNTRALTYTDGDGRLLFAAPATRDDIEDSDDLQTVRVKVDRTFPIWGREARARGFDLPKPFGASLLYTDMTTQMNFTSFEINGEREDIEAIFDPNGSGIDVDASVAQLRGDWFILPFLNVMVIAGNAEAKGDLLINTTDLGDFVGLPEILEGQLDLDLTMGGVGVAAAGGYKNFIGALTITYLKTLTEGADTDSTAISVTPLVGYQFLDWRMQFLFGAEYLDLQKKMEGSIDLGGGESLDFNIGVESEEWAWRTGVRKEFGSNWEALATYSWGASRDGWTLMFGYRF